jgi:hypothetical protein
MTTMTRRAVLFGAWAGLAAAAACGGEEPTPAPAADTGGADTGKAAPPAIPPPAAAKPTPGLALLVAQSEFKPNAEGKYTVPDAAGLVILEPRADGTWRMDRIQDRESNVFHKAIQIDGGGILTIGANQARLKLWRKEGSAWKAETLWSPTFGGEQNRLRDFEAADFDDDGRTDLAIATHDQGVVAVGWNRADGWAFDEIDRKPDTFVHEIEIGDLDGDGKLEIYATPSQPNTASGLGQGGAIVRYAWDGAKFARSEVAALDKRHVKEVLVADLEGDGRQELYAALEAEMGPGGAIVTPVEIRRYDWKGAAFAAAKVADLDDRFCRFLAVGDVDHDNAAELVASAFSSGVWVIERGGDGYGKQCIDAETGGFEHSAYLADLDGAPGLELYVADDSGGSVDRYVYDGKTYAKSTVNRRPVPGQAMVWNITTASLSK